MCAYNKINGTYCSDNRWLLTDVLRNEWGFDGTVVTDWGAMSDRVKSFQAGCDLCMPGGSAYMEEEAFEAVQNGGLSEKDIDSCVSRIMHLAECKSAVFAKLPETTAEEKEAVLERHCELAKKIALESEV